MAPGPPSITAAESRSSATRRRVSRPRTWLGGGPAGNEQLTAATGIVLIVVLAAIGVTIVRIGQLLWLHLFLGLLVIGPVVLKMASTGYRFVRYYTNNQAYRRKGPPEAWLRLIGPIVVVTTIAVLVSGVVLLFGGPALRDPLVLIHKVAFIAWVAFTALHILGHLPGLTAAWRPVDPDRRLGRHSRRSGPGDRPDPGVLSLDRARRAAPPPRLTPSAGVSGEPLSRAQGERGRLVAVQWLAGRERRRLEFRGELGGLVGRLTRLGLDHVMDVHRVLRPEPDIDLAGFGQLVDHGRGAP
jgi:hypothetical protein